MINKIFLILLTRAHVINKIFLTLLTGAHVINKIFLTWLTRAHVINKIFPLSRLCHRTKHSKNESVVYLVTGVCFEDSLPTNWVYDILYLICSYQNRHNYYMTYINALFILAKEHAWLVIKRVKRKWYFVNRKMIFLLINSACESRDQQTRFKKGPLPEMTITKINQCLYFFGQMDIIWFCCS